MSAIGPRLPIAEPTDARRFADEAARHLHRIRVGEFLVWIPIWLLSVVPLARWIADGVGAVALSYVAVGAVSLGVAAAIRGLYVLLRRSQSLWSPWLFVIAAFLAINGYFVQSAGHKGAFISFLPLN